MLLHPGPILGHVLACLGITRLLIGITRLLICKAAQMLQERDQLKARARDEAAALEARKNKVTVTVDLLGRQVTSANAFLLCMIWQDGKV